MEYLVRKFMLDDSGATAIEYALIGSLIFLAIVVGVSSVGQTVTAMYENVAAKLSNAE